VSFCEYVGDCSNNRSHTLWEQNYVTMVHVFYAVPASVGSAYTASNPNHHRRGGGAWADTGTNTVLEDFTPCDGAQAFVLVQAGLLQVHFVPWDQDGSKIPGFLAERQHPSPLLFGHVYPRLGTRPSFWPVKRASENVVNGEASESPQLRIAAD
jgi:hypothetical protein